MPRKREIEAAIAAYNDADDGLLLPPDAVRLLSVMFPRTSLFRGSVQNLMARGFDKPALRKLLNSLTIAGFLSKELGRRGITLTYHLHLPPLVRR